MGARPAVFKWRQTEPGLILCAVQWYLRYSLSLVDVEELLAERGLNIDHTTVWRRVQYYGPELEQRLRRRLKPTNKSWRVDETYVRVKGRWCYLYRAIDSAGAPIDFLLSAFRDADAAKRLFRKALSNPETRSSPNRFQSRHRSAMRIAAYGTLCRIVDNGILPSEFTVSDRGLTAEFAHGREGLTYRIFKLFRAPMEYLRSTTILVYRNHPAAPVAPACFLA